MDKMLGTTGREKFPDYEQSRRSVVDRLIKENNLEFGAELGVQSGYLFFHLLDTHPNLILFGVDSWIGTNQEAYAKMKKEVNEKVVDYKNGMIMNMTTNEAAAKTPDESLDFVFIDADHSYPACKIDMEKWMSKVKVGGYIIGHDCEVSSVKRAIEEVFGKNYQKDVDQVWYVQKKMSQ